MEIVKLILDGDSQSVQLPDGFHFDGEEVYIKQMGNMVVLFPLNDPWSVLEESLAMFSDGFMEDRGQPDMKVGEKEFE